MEKMPGSLAFGSVGHVQSPPRCLIRRSFGGTRWSIGLWVASVAGHGFINTYAGDLSPIIRGESVIAPKSKPKPRGRPKTYANPTDREREKKRRQRAKEAASHDEHPDRVVFEDRLFWFEVWVSADSVTPEGRKVHTEGYRRFGEAASRTPYRLIAKLPKEYQARAKKVLEAEGWLPKRTAEMRPRNPEYDYDREGKDALRELSANVADYADLTVTERIAEINERAGATNTKGEGAGQSTYEPPRTDAATVSDAAHLLRTYGPELAVGPTASDAEIAAFAAWWEEYLRPYGGGPTIPAKIVRVSEEQAAEARQRVERLLEEYPAQASCPTCGTSPLAFHESTLTVGCPECNTICFVSIPNGTQYVGRKRTLSPQEEEEAAWASRDNR